MLERFKTIDKELKERKDKRSTQTHALAVTNLMLAKDRSEEQIQVNANIRAKDKEFVILDKIAAENVKLKERRKAEERRIGY